MAQNNLPIFTSTPLVTGVMLTGSVGSTRSDGIGTIGTDMFLICSGSASGSYIQKIRITPIASAPTTMTATVIRIFFSTKISGATNPTNTFLQQEVAVGALAAANAANSTNPYEFPMNFALPVSTSLLASMHTASFAATAWAVTAFGGDYL